MSPTAGRSRMRAPRWACRRSRSTTPIRPRRPPSRSSTAQSSRTRLPPISIICKSAVERRPEICVRRRLSTARSWSQTATEFGPADGVATTIGGLGCGPVESGTTTIVRRARLSASAVIMTQAASCGSRFPRSDRDLPTRSHRVERQPVELIRALVLHSGPTGGAALPNPSPIAAASHSAISADRSLSSSTASAAL